MTNRCQPQIPMVCIHIKTDEFKENTCDTTSSDTTAAPAVEHFETDTYAPPSPPDIKPILPTQSEYAATPSPPDIKPTVSSTDAAPQFETIYVPTSPPDIKPMLSVECVYAPSSPDSDIKSTPATESTDIKPILFDTEQLYVPPSLDIRPIELTVTPTIYVADDIQAMPIPIAMTCGQRIPCTICMKTFSDRRNLKKHIQNIHVNRDVRYACDLCDKSFTQPYSLAYHKELHTTSEKKCSVADCPFTSKHPKRLEKHFRQQHTIQSAELFACDICQKTFAGTKRLQKHLQVHGPDNHFCTFCNNKAFKTRAAFKTHMKTKHSSVNYVECDVCLKAFTNAMSVHNHKRRMHQLDGKRYKCDICAKQFLQHSHIKRHMLSHSGRRDHICSVCGEAFAIQYSLKTHMFQHHFEEKPYGCDVCLKTFARNDYLKKHLLLHTGEKPFECDICKKRISRYSNLRTHLFSHQRVGARFACRVCLAKFLRQKELDMHVCGAGADEPMMDSDRYELFGYF